MLDIATSSNPVQYQGNLMMQTWENGEITNFELNFGPTKLFSRVLPLLVVRHCFKLPSYTIYRRTNGANLRKGQKTYFRAQFWAPFGRGGGVSLLDVKHSRKLTSYAIARKTYDPESRKWRKTSLWVDFVTFSLNLGPQIFFSWVLLLLDVRHCRKLSSYAISRKAYETNSRKWQKKTRHLQAAIFFLKSLAWLVNRCHGQLS